jgi:hypothetical protein
MGGLAAVNLKISSDSHADEKAPLTEAAYEECISTLTKSPLNELPRTIQQDRFAHLIA